MARRIPKEFVPVDITLPDRSQTRRAGIDGELLYYRSLIWCKANAWTNGFIPASELEAVGKRIPEARRAKAAALLVVVGYWVEYVNEDGELGWLIPSWLAWNPSREEMDEKRARRTLGSQQTNHRRWHKRAEPRDDCPFCEAEDWEGVTP